MKPGGKDGKLYGIDREAVITGASGRTTLEKSGFYQIKSVGESTGFPQPDTAQEFSQELWDDYFKMHEVEEKV